MACSAQPGSALRYEDLIAAEQPGFEWPELDERSASSLCYTTGTTGEPKGVAYSHRSVYLRSMAEWGAFTLTERDPLLVIVPIFHVNAWGFPYTAWMLGADLLMPASCTRSPSPAVTSRVQPVAARGTHRPDGRRAVSVQAGGG